MRLNGLGLTAVFTYTETNGSQIVVMQDGSVYQVDPDTGNLMLRIDLTRDLTKPPASSGGKSYWFLGVAALALLAFGS